MAAAIAGTLRMLLSLQFRPHIGPIFSDDSMAEVARNQQGLRVILVLRSNAGGGAISARVRAAGRTVDRFNSGEAHDFAAAELRKSGRLHFYLSMIFSENRLSPVGS